MQKSKRQTTLALWKFVVNWDVRFWKGEKKSVEYFSRTFRYLLCKNKLIGNQFFIGIGIPKYACEITVSSKKILKKIFDLRHEKQFERRGVASYEELLILFLTAVLKGLLAVDRNVVTTPAKFAHSTISPLMLCDDAVGFTVTSTTMCF